MQRFWPFRKEFSAFLGNSTKYEECSIFSFLRNDEEMETVEFWANIVSQVNDVNIKLQGEKHTTFDLRDS